MKGVREEQVGEIADGSRQRSDIGDEGAEQDVGAAGTLSLFTRASITA